MNDSPRTLRNLCVFCGSSPGRRPSYAEAAARFGRTLASRGLGLVFGGGNAGLMGAVSSACRDAGGAVRGIIPERIAAMVPGQSGIDLEVVPGMHARKARMYALSDGFVALPGGMGTLDELFEAWTWTQLGYHEKPVALLDADGFWDALAGFLDHVTEEGFIKPPHRSSLIVASDPDELIEAMAAWHPAGIPKI